MVELTVFARALAPELAVHDWVQEPAGVSKVAAGELAALRRRYKFRGVEELAGGPSTAIREVAAFEFLPSWVRSV